MTLSLCNEQDSNASQLYKKHLSNDHQLTTHHSDLGVTSHREVVHDVDDPPLDQFKVLRPQWTGAVNGEYQIYVVSLAVHGCSQKRRDTRARD